MNEPFSPLLQYKKGRQFTWVIGDGWLKLDLSGPFSWDFDSWAKVSEWWVEVRDIEGHSLLHLEGARRVYWDGSLCVAYGMSLITLQTTLNILPVQIPPEYSWTI